MKAEHFILHTSHMSVSLYGLTVLYQYQLSGQNQGQPLRGRIESPHGVQDVRDAAATGKRTPSARTASSIVKAAGMIDIATMPAPNPAKPCTTPAARNAAKMQMCSVQISIRK